MGKAPSIADMKINVAYDLSLKYCNDKKVSEVLSHAANPLSHFCFGIFVFIRLPNHPAIFENVGRYCSKQLRRIVLDTRSKRYFIPTHF